MPQTTTTNTETTRVKSLEKEAPNAFFQAGLRDLFKLSLLIPCLLIGLVASLEMIFAAAHIGEDTVVKPDPLLGYAHLENKPLTYRQEGYSRSTTNELGFRDKSYALVKEASTTRIAVMGDSMTVGMEVPQNKTFSKLLETKLNSEGKGKFEVMNCGMSGFGSGQEYLLYRQKVQQFKPDLLIVTYNYGDSDDNVFQRAGMNPPRPIFRSENGALKVEYTDIDKWYATNDARFYNSFEWLRRSSRLLAVLNKLNLDLSNSDPIYQKFISIVGTPSSYAWSNLLSLLPPCKPDFDAARACVATLPQAQKHAKDKPGDVSAYASANEYKRIFMANDAKSDVALSILGALNQDCKKNNCKLVIACGPALTNSMFYYQELADISRQAQTDGYTVLETNHEFPSREPMQNSKYFFGLHFTQAGHQLMSEAIYKGLFAGKDGHASAHL